MLFPKICKAPTRKVIQTRRKYLILEVTSRIFTQDEDCREEENLRKLDSVLQNPDSAEAVLYIAVVVVVCIAVVVVDTVVAAVHMQQEWRLEPADRNIVAVARNIAAADIFVVAARMAAEEVKERIALVEEHIDSEG